jgi:PAS domain S-box-containing protein
LQHFTTNRTDARDRTVLARLALEAMSTEEDGRRLSRKLPGSSAEEFALLVDGVRDYAIFLLSPEGVIRSWNKGAARIMGYDAEEVLGRHFSIFYDEEQQQKPAMELEVASAEGRVEDEGWRIRKDGTRFWANTIITALREKDGSLHGFGKVTRDTTAIREADQRLRESAEIFQLLVSSVSDYAIFMLDPEGKVTTWNVGAQRIKGYTPEEIIGRHFSIFYTDEDVRDGKPERKLAAAREAGSVEDEGWRRRKDGSRFWANVVITAVRDSHGNLRGFAKVTRDMTERKKAEEIQKALLEQREARLQAEEERQKAQASYRAAQEANRAKDEFLMTLSHELRTPMTSILGWARLLPSLKSEDPFFSEAVTAISSSAQLQARLIDDLLDVSRIVSGKLRLTPETVETAQIIRNAVDAVTPSADAKGITITTSFAADLGTIVADPTRIQQVIWNLLSNAVKFTPRNGSVAISARRTASHVQIVVRDTGEGIDTNFLPHVFEAFRQAETPRTRVHGGLGLGLSIVQHITEAHGGTVTAESEGRGHGAAFTVTLPVAALTVTRSKPEAAPTPEPAFYRDRLTGVEIVLVDDDRETRRMVTVVLRAAGATILPFDSATEALQSIERRRPDMVITDIAMPEVDGYAFTRAIRLQKHGAKLKVVALSAFPAATGNAGEFDAYLTKPIDPSDLVDQIARIAVRTSA